MEINDKDKHACGQLFVVATPIGNLSDLSFRAVDVLKSASCIAAEDTRNSMKLMHYYSIKTPMIACHEHNESQLLDTIRQRLDAGEDVALISDAGTPLINDPGYVLVKALRSDGYRVVPVPGACSPMVALSVSGLATDQFTYYGFLPRSGQSRADFLAEIAASRRTSIVLESPKRVYKTLQDLQLYCSDDREVCLARELTKLHETIITQPLSCLLTYIEQHPLKGEVVLLIGSKSVPDEVSDADIETCLQQALFADLAPSRRAQAVAEHLHIAKSRVYNFMLALKSGSDA